MAVCINRLTLVAQCGNEDIVSLPLLLNWVKASFQQYRVERHEREIRLDAMKQYRCKLEIEKQLKYNNEPAADHSQLEQHLIPLICLA